ncbi:YcnI family copper-binding membrane protein [Caenibacillus caldisaponilyticus]|uniref:YcnI family copper-binding membrane protein n=1 Tax=Caenibacillus caldisaponilyticus TaxID=1674942 RepID=UPI001EE71126|nr:YcnI family protein [Caenibacillus caldisaponilyticus]
MKNMKKWLTIIPALFAAAFLFAGVASAHVTVSPNQVPADSYQKFTVKVPTEKNVPTVKVKVEIPKDVDIASFEPVPGWKYQVEKDANGKITSVTWTAEGQGLLPEQFGEFNMMGKVAANAKSLAWKAYQTYKDGSVVKWIGPEGSDYPASVTQVTAAGTGEATADHHHASMNATDQTDSDQNPWALYLAILAVVISTIALIVNFVGKEKKA